MKSTRERILQTLISHPRSTITDLASTVGINPISVRHHLTSLQAKALVAAEEERHGVGRPRLVYFLTEKGLELFPTSYLRLTTRLLDEMKQSLPPHTVSNLFAKIASDLADKYSDQIQDLSIEDRLDLIKSLLAEEGFTVEWEMKGDRYHIHEITCPYYHVGQNHPEVCMVDQILISKVLSIPVEKINCILKGDNLCTYVIPKCPQKETTI